MNYILKQPIKYGYTQISNDICDDERVSDIAIAIYAYIKKHATTFKLCLEDIAKRFNRSLPTVHKYLNELRDLGYLEFERERKSDGTFGKFLRFFLANHPKNPSVKQSKNTANQNKTVLFWLKPQIQGSNAENTEAQSTSKNFDAFTLIKDQNKHENIRVSENFSTSEFAEKNQICKDAKDLKNPNENLAFKSSKIKNPSLFNRFSAFFSSILGNLDTKNLNQCEKSAFEEFLNYRNEKHKLSYSTKKALLKQCETLKAKGCDLVACIEQSIRRNYNEIYEVMHFEKPSYKSEAEQKNDEVMSHFEFKGSNPKFGGLCIW
ncbi:winged helix-turn-helix domain-containing protein [Helicobacter pylori]|uniref:winged helix-turn-helix domain-containing protein n=1 Tax=Helicobacter pylori TaxID=210 RepID=UPI002711D6FA|nr:winged helix-turn-helix domain-containing protein [Helicobacter pylori]MDO7813924.1 winged helix-turn-helix domain-containing protein [Helicobacter pylori]